MAHSHAMQSSLNGGYYHASSRGDTAFLPSMETTNDQREAARLAARREAKELSEFPTSVSLNGVDIPIFRYTQVEGMNKKLITQAAMNLRDAIDSSGCRFFDHYTQLKLNSHASHENLVRWFMNVQLIICNRLGYGFTPQSFGCPKDENLHPGPQQHAPPSRSSIHPCWSQADLDDRIADNVQRSSQPQQQRMGPNEAELYQPNYDAYNTANSIAYHSKKTQFSLG